MNILAGLLIIALGSFGQSSSYVPIRKVKQWEWENFWLVQGIFAWLVFPFLGTLLSGSGSLCQILLTDGVATLKTVGYGILWGVGGLTFGLSMRYLGVALGQSLALGTCAAFGTLIPAVMNSDNLFSGSGLVLLLGVCITLAGIAVIGYAGSLRAKDMNKKEKSAAVKEFALKKGLLIALLAGVMSACFSLGLNAGAPVKAAAMANGANELFALNPVIFLVTIGGFLTNCIYCVYQNIKNKTGNRYFNTSGTTLCNNLLFCALAGILWYLQFFGLGVGQTFLKESLVMIAFSWSILMSLNVLFSNVWGILLKEWTGTGRKTIGVLVLGMLLLVFSLIFPNLF
ncbi:L-rhamnose-proton symporter [termite gut metagenome]|uniref:L-rhamnose-proton symporter n=1 Tax=termite gut metagenome TaxID=433724 RepID=A0A5J4SSM6_9ZZZZ